MNIINENKAVGLLSELLALEYGAGAAFARQIRAASALHDVGKQKIPIEILMKPGALTPREFNVMKTHTTIGAEMLSNIKGDLGVLARNCCEFHHEYYNGTGYWGKRTDDLPFYCQFVGIADVFIALLSGRCYKEPWPPDEAVRYIQDRAGTQFSPELVGVFLPLILYDKRAVAIFTGGR